MTLRMLCDENSGAIRLYRRLDDDPRFVVERVVDVPSLGPQARDGDIWQYAVSDEYIVFTHDPDFVDGNADPGDGTYPGVIFRDDRSWDRIFEAFGEIESHYTQQQVIDMGNEVHVPGGWV